MATQDSNIILSGIMANPLEAMARGMEIGEAQNVLRRRTALEQAYQQHGEGALAGNPESLNALARLGDFKNPTSIQAHRQDMAFNREEMEFKRAKNRREAADWAREVSAEAAAAEQEKLSRILMGAAAFHAKGDKEGYDNHLRTYRLDPAKYPFENFVSHAASMTGTIEGIKEVRELMAGPKPDYVTLNDQLVDRNAQGGPAVVPVQGMQPGKGGTAAEQEIARLEAIGIPHDIAVKINAGVYKSVTDPITRETVIFDLASREPVFRANGNGQTAPTGQPAPQEDRRLSFGQAFENSPDSFGLEGLAKRGINTVAGAIGADAPYSGVEATQADFAAMRENLLQTISSGYNRQPPSWLMKEIRENIPATASAFEGPDRAQSKLNALGRTFVQQLESINKQLRGPLAPGEIARLKAQASALESAIDTVSEALGSFGGAEGNKTKSGVSWRVVE